MLTGNEDVAQIYAYILQNQTKQTYREIIKFRKRTNYFEYLTILFQKALNEELNQEIGEWAYETIDWLSKRNSNIIGHQLNLNRKGDTFMIIHTKSLPSDMDNDPNNQTPVKKKPKPKRSKKYKLLIPLDLDLNEKLKLEEKQKKAIDVLYNMFTVKYEDWIRRRKLRKQFMEESAFKSQFFALWALNDFYILINRIQPSSALEHAFFENQVNSSSYLDAQLFLFEKNKALLLPSNGMLHLRYPNQSVVSNLTSKSKKPETSKSNNTDKSKQIDTNFSINNQLNEEKLISDLSIKDTSDLFAKIMCAYDQSNQHNNSTFKSIQENDDNDLENSSHTGVLYSADFVEMATTLFNKFKYSIVIAHRGKQWTQLQNVCKLMFNCMNAFLVRLPAATNKNKRLYKIDDLWKSLLPSIYIAAENLLDMLFYTSPIEVSFIFYC
jgi:hypothetical protein